MTDEKRPVDQAVELVLYAPLGLALEARRLMPTFVERGRQQVLMAKMIGQFAVKQGQREAGSRLGGLQQQAETILAELGLVPAAETSTDAAPTITEPMAADVVPIRSSAASGDLAIADYDSLAASQVIPRLAGLSAGELDAVRSYEAAHRGRKTVLGKITQLQGT